MKKILTTCPYCGVGCGLYLSVTENDNIKGVEPSVEHIVSRGELCIKGLNAYQFVNHPDRLTEPMIRKNGKLTPTTWDNALNYIVIGIRKIQTKYGKDAVAFFSSAKTTNEENFLMMKLARAVFGTNNIDHCARLCHSSTVVAAGVRTRRQDS